MKFLLIPLRFCEFALLCCTTHGPSLQPKDSVFFAPPRLGLAVGQTGLYGSGVSRRLAGVDSAPKLLDAGARRGVCVRRRAHGVYAPLCVIVSINVFTCVHSYLCACVANYSTV